MAVAEMRRNDVTAKVDAEVMRMAKVVAAYEDKSIAEYLTEVLRPIVERDLARHAAKVRGRKSEPKGGE